MVSYTLYRGIVLTLSLFVVAVHQPVVTAEVETATEEKKGVTLVDIQEYMDKGLFETANKLLQNMHEQFPDKMGPLVMWDVCSHALNKTKEERLDMLREKILDLWTKQYKENWENAGKPLQSSSWTRFETKSENYFLQCAEFFVPLQSANKMMAHYKVVAMPNENEAREDMGLRLFKVETITRDKESLTKLFVVNEYFADPNKAPVDIGLSSYNDKTFTCTKLLEDLSSYLDYDAGAPIRDIADDEL